MENLICDTFMSHYMFYGMMNPKFIRFTVEIKIFRGGSNFKDRQKEVKRPKLTKHTCTELCKSLV